MHNGRDTDPAVERWAGAGHSDDPDPARAGAEAVAGAIVGNEPRLVLVFASPRHDLDALAPAAEEAAGQAELVGCSTTIGIGADGPAEGGVSALALGGRGFAAASAAAALAGADSRQAGASAARCLDDLDDGLPHRALIVLADGLSGDPQEVARGAYSVAGATVSLVGACAGRRPPIGETGQLRGGRAIRGSVVAAALASEAPMGVGIRHGWRTRGEPVLVTAVDGKTVHALNDRPALDVYLDLLDAPEQARWDPAAFIRFALLHPLGVAGARGREAQVRAVVDADFEARSLQCIAELPTGTLAWLMEGAREKVLDASGPACAEAVAALRGEPPLALLAFDSAARAGVLGKDGVREERARIAAAAGGAPVARLSSYGEIARVRGSAGFQSQALAVLAIG